MKAMSHAAQKYSGANKFAIFRALRDGAVAQCAAEVQGRWIDEPAGVDGFAASRRRAALIDAARGD